MPAHLKRSATQAPESVSPGLAAASQIDEVAKKHFTCCEESAKSSVKLGGREIPYTLRRSSRAKNLRLEVSLETGLLVVSPPGFDLADIKGILLKKQVWILDKLDGFAAASANRGLCRQEGGWRVFYRGREYDVDLKTWAGSSCKVEVEEERLVVTVPEGAGDVAAAALERWFRRMARLLVNQRIRLVNRDLNLSFNKVSIKGQKTRWGSCSGKKNLNFNWRLVMAPLQVLDYVVAHELMHLLEPNHSKKFWSLVEGICPEYKAHRAWLKKNGQRLKL